MNLKTSSSQPPKGMVLVSAGKFIRGTSEKEYSYFAKQAGYHPGAGYLAYRALDETPQKEIYLDDFYIDIYPVTNSQFDEFVKATGYITDDEKIREEEYYWKKYYTIGKEFHPVVCVSWHDAFEYSKWIGKRLPTEAEWEKAARGTDARIFPWGDDFDKNLLNSLHSNICETTPVNSYPLGISPYGCYDMAGNVCEWCADWYDKNSYNTSSLKNPKGPLVGQNKVLRGGSWKFGAYYIRSAYRNYAEGASYIDRGFRCAMSL